MTNDLIPPDRIKFYNTFVTQAILSAVQAIDDSIEDLTGNRCDEELRREIESIISAACKDYRERLDATLVRTTIEIATDFGDFHLRAAARISNAISDSIGQEVIEKLGIPILQEVNRTLRNVVESLVGFYRDFLSDMGVTPDDLSRT